MASSTHTRPLKDAAFTGNVTFKIINQSIGAGLTAVLNVNSFTGGVAPSLRLQMFLVDDDGNIVMKMNGGVGFTTVVGPYILIYAPVAVSGSTIGDDKNIGVVPARFVLQVDDDAGDQDSADIALDVIIS